VTAHGIDHQKFFFLISRGSITFAIRSSFKLLTCAALCAKANRFVMKKIIPIQLTQDNMKDKNGLEGNKAVL
jgi:hypothetical protein